MHLIIIGVVVGLLAIVAAASIIVIVLYIVYQRNKPMPTQIVVKETIALREQRQHNYKIDHDGYEEEYSIQPQPYNYSYDVRMMRWLREHFP